MLRIHRFRTRWYVNVKNLYSGFYKKEINYIFDPDSFFNQLLIPDTPIVRKIISEIDYGCYKDETSFIDRFNVSLYMRFLSTTSKSLILVHMFPDKIIDFMDCGANCGIVLPVLNGSIYATKERLCEFEWNVSGTRFEVCIDGNIITNFDIFEEVIYEEI